MRSTKSVRSVKCVRSGTSVRSVSEEHKEYAECKCVWSGTSVRSVKNVRSVRNFLLFCILFQYPLTLFKHPTVPEA